MNKSGDDFLHIKGNTSFQQRTDAIFSCLDNLEPNEVEELQDQDEQEDKVKEGEAVRPRRVADHVLHPEKWKKYSLEDVDEEVGGLSGDALNKHAALSFLTDLKKRKVEAKNDTPTSPDEDAEMREKVVFSKDVIRHKMEVDELITDGSNASQPTLGGVHVMPEHVVGQTPSKKSKKYHNSPSQHASADVVGLSHLDEGEREETEDFVSSKGGSESEAVGVDGCKTEEQGQQEQNVTLFAKRKSKGSRHIRKREEEESNDNN